MEKFLVVSFELRLSIFHARFLLPSSKWFQFGRLYDFFLSSSIFKRNIKSRHKNSIKITGSKVASRYEFRVFNVRIFPSYLHDNARILRVIRLVYSKK